MLIEKIKFGKHHMDIDRYGKQNSLRFDSLEFKRRF